MALVARLLQSLPLVIVLVILALVIYFVVSWARSPERAKEVLIKFFTVFNSILSIFFLLATAYAFFEGNQPVLELYGFVPGGCGVGPCCHPCLPLALRERTAPITWIKARGLRSYRKGDPA